MSEKHLTNDPREFPAWLRKRAEGHAPGYDIAVYARPYIWIALADAIEACSAPDWQPIDTAPKDQEVEVRGRWKLRGDGVEFTHWRPLVAEKGEK